MFYHPFKKTVKGKNGKSTKRWYYWWIDPITGIQHQKLIPNVSNQSEAYVYISTEEEFIFQRDDGRPLRQEFLESVFHRVIIKAGIDSTDRKLCPHSFRFTYVTRMRRKVDAETVQKMVGHSSVEMT